ncbi:MAG: hypothetical protein DCC71_25305 [Proteobacteria bacterium]|nr:MAG: hypothetical protein DCC71_25305 [Pseudomonadota bacterium]
MDLDLVHREDGRAIDEATALAAQAEGRRRDGDADGALALAREALEHEPEHAAARATLALALLDLGRDGEARRELEMLTAEPAPAPMAALPIDEDELDEAFAVAAPEEDAMHDASEVAYEAMRAADLDAPELGDAPAPDSPFHTATMAALLERQGDADGARAIRAALSQRAAPADPTRENAESGRGRRKGHVIRTLERWLERLQRGDA